MPGARPLSAWALATASVVTLLLAEMLRLHRQARRLRAECERAGRLRLEERAGRTAAERKLREAHSQSSQPEQARQCKLTAIGTLASCFVDRRGTPRQGMLAPAARSQLKLDPNVIQPSALEGLEQFTHVWLIFEFHENTNASKLADGSRNVKAKVHPPALGGEKVGLFATRTPHRPNPIGLSVARLIELRGDTLTLGGADLVDGTPILDIKPYLRHDIQPDAAVPSWCENRSDASAVAEVRFSPEADAALVAAAPRLRFFGDASSAREAVVQMLQLDIRSVHQGRGHGTSVRSRPPEPHWCFRRAPPSGERFGTRGRQAGQLYSVRVDALTLEFVTYETHVLVVSCELSTIAPLESNEPPGTSATTAEVADQPSRAGGGAPGPQRPQRSATSGAAARKARKAAARHVGAGTMLHVPTS